MFACTSQGLYHSGDNVSTLEPVYIAGLDLYQSYFNAMLVNGNDLFLGAHGDGILYSSDNGNNWSTRNTNLTALTVSQLVSQRSYLFASTSNGLYRSSVALPCGKE